MQSAKKYFDAGKYSDAVLLYRKAIQKDPKSGEAYYRLALTEMKLGKIPEAYQALSEASKFSAGNEEIQSVFADLCFEIYLVNPKHPKSFYDQVANVSAQLLQKNQRSYDGLRLKGYLALADRKPSDAIEDFRKADQLRPMQPQVVYPLGTALVQDHQAGEAEKLAVTFLQKNKTFGPMYDLLFQIYAGSGRKQEAEDILKAKADNNPKQAGYVLNLAGYYWAQKRPDDARKTLQRLLDNPKDFKHPYALVGDFYLAARDIPEAMNQYSQGVKSDAKDQILYEKKIVNALILEGKKDEAKTKVQELAKSNPQDDEIQVVEATLWIESGKPQEVSAAVNTLKPLADKKPGDANIRYRLGQAYQMQGKTQDAEAEWRASAKDDPAFLPSRVALAELELQTNRPSETLRLCEEILGRDPQNKGVQFLRALALASLSRPDDARAVLNQLLQEAPNSTLAKLAVARLDLMQKHFPEAEKEFSALYKVGQQDLRPLDGLLATYFAEKESAKGLALLEKELRGAPENPALIARYAELNAQVGNYTVALTQYRRLLAKDPNSARLNLRLGEISLLAKDNDGAMQSIQKAAQLDPKNERAQIELGSLLLSAGKKREALDQFRKALAQSPDQPGILNNVAYLIADTGGDTKEAMDLVRKGLQKVPNDPHLNDTIGFIYWKQHLNDSALQTFRAVVQKDPDNPTFRLHLANALLTKGDRDGARVQLEAALNRNPGKEEQNEINSLLASIGR